MKIVGVCACTSGIAHTYISREKLIQAAEKLGHSIYVETQGTIGTEFELTRDQINEADIVVLAVDIGISTDRFKGKKTIKIPTHLVIKGPEQVVKKLEELVNEKS